MFIRPLSASHKTTFSPDQGLQILFLTAAVAPLTQEAAEQSY